MHKIKTWHTNKKIHCWLYSLSIITALCTTTVCFAGNSIVDKTKEKESSEGEDARRATQCDLNIRFINRFTSLILFNLFCGDTAECHKQTARENGNNRRTKTGETARWRATVVSHIGPFKLSDSINEAESFPVNQPLRSWFPPARAPHAGLFPQLRLWALIQPLLSHRSLFIQSARPSGTGPFVLITCG